MNILIIFGTILISVLLYVILSVMYYYWLIKIVKIDDEALAVASCWMWPVSFPIALLILFGIKIYSILTKNIG